MRKRLAILILLSMTLSLLCGTVFAERPATVNSAKAGIRVDLARGGTYYFETLTPELFLWLSTEAGENSTVTLLQDLTLSSKEGTNFLSLGQTVGDTPAIVLDLNDFRLYYHGPSNLFAIPYDGDLTVKNGTVYYECTGNSRSPFVLGATSSQQCDPAVWHMELILHGGDGSLHGGKIGFHGGDHGFIGFRFGLGRFQFAGEGLDLFIQPLHFFQFGIQGLHLLIQGGDFLLHIPPVTGKHNHNNNRNNRNDSQQNI